jgi:hypothetical protein
MGGGGGRGGAKSYIGEKAWSSKNHSILSGYRTRQTSDSSGFLLVEAACHDEPFKRQRGIGEDYSPE